MFEDEFNFFLEHQGELAKTYAGKYLIIRGPEVVDAFDSTLEAYLAARGRFDPGTFMIQPAGDGAEAYTVSIAPILETR